MKIPFTKYRLQLLQFVFVWEKMAGRYFMLLPVINIFPISKHHRDSWFSIHVGWLLWLMHFKFHKFRPKNEKQ